MKLSRAVSLAAIVLAAGSKGALAEDVVTMPAVEKTIRQVFSAAAHVQPVSNIVLAASTTGTVSGLRVIPGDAVHRGQIIARMTGQTVVAQTVRLATELQSAQLRAAAAQQLATIDEQQLANQLVTRDAVLRAQADRDTARQQLLAARAASQSYESLLPITAPQSGVVTAVSAADGQFASAGQTLVTIAPTNSLYVVATFYGDDATHVAAGMQGTFAPDGSSPPLRVTVQRTSPDVTRSGQLDVWLKPSDGHALPVGMVGTLSLTATTRRVAVPSSALVLDGGQWWVLVHDTGGEHRRRVTPGSADAGWTAIERGIAPNERVVIQDAYLLFHNAFAKRYQQPD